MFKFMPYVCDGIAYWADFFFLPCTDLKFSYYYDYQ